MLAAAAGRHGDAFAEPGECSKRCGGMSQRRRCVVGLSSRFFADVDSTLDVAWERRKRVVRVFPFRCATGTDGASCSTDSDANNQGRSRVPITHATHSLGICSKPARCSRALGEEQSPDDDASVQPCARLLASCRSKSVMAGAHRPLPLDDSAGEASARDGGVGR